MSAGRLRYEALWILAGRALAAIASFAAVRILTAVMPPELYGRYALTIGIASLITGFLINPVVQGINRLFYEAIKVGVLRDFVRRSVGSTSALSVLGGALAFPVFWWYLSSSDDWWRVAGLVVVMLIAGNLRDRSIGMFNLFRWRGRFVALSALDAWLRVVCVAFAVTVAGPSMVAAAAGLAFSAVVCACLSLPWLSELIRRNDASETRNGKFDTGPLFALSRPLFIVAGFAWVLSTSDRYLLGKMVAADDLGRYVAGYQIANAGFTVVMGVFFPIALPIMLQKVAASAGRTIPLDEYVILITVAAVTFGAAAAVDVGGVSHILLSSRKFDSGSAVIPLICLGTVPQGIQNVVEQQAHFAQRTWPLVVAYALAAVSNLALNLILVPRIGIAGAALSTLGSYLVLLGGTVVVCKPQVALLTWGRTFGLVASAIVIALAARAAIPESLPTIHRALGRWTAFAVAYGPVAVLLTRNEWQLARTILHRRAPAT